MSDDVFGNRVVRFLRRVKRRLCGAKDGSWGYRRRLERELARADRAFAGGGAPVLIHTYGKVGSTAIHTEIAKLSGFQSFQTHFITKDEVAVARAAHQEHDRDPIHLKLGERLRERLDSDPAKVVRIVTLVRDPVARAVSDLFENPQILLGPGGGDLRSMAPDRVVEIAAEHVLSSHGYTEHWFDREWSGLLGFDFFAEPFDREAGFVLIERGRFRILAGKLELLSNHGGRFLGDFLGLGRELEIPRRRSRSATGEASLYDEVRARLKLPAAVLDEVYTSRVARHFYSGEEIAGFRRHWE